MCSLDNNTEEILITYLDGDSDSFDKNEIKIIAKGEDKTNDIHSLSENTETVYITYSNSKTYTYKKDDIQLKYSTLLDETTSSCFEYFKEIAKTVSIIVKGKNILENSYERIGFIDEETMLSAFLTKKIKPIKKQKNNITIYPFGFNISQKAAIDHALENQLVIIEGPPGTGKTQTILNIIANVVMNGKSIAAVSSNNSATSNVQEKLKKYGIDFISAYLGNYDNKIEFIDSQKLSLDISTWALSTNEENSIHQTLQVLHDTLNTMLEKKNELSQIQQRLDAIELEYAYFCDYRDYSEELLLKCLKSPPTSSTALDLWLISEKYIECENTPSFFEKILNYILRGINKNFYSTDPDIMIAICQKFWYIAQTLELKNKASSLQTELDDFDFQKKMEQTSDLSIKLFRSFLAKKYNKKQRQQFDFDDLRNNSNAFIEEYPVILSTTYSISSSLSHDIIYDYIIIDEASQVDLAAGALALSCARNAVIVGDLKQLPNVVDSDKSKKTDMIFEKYNLGEIYRYKNHSLLFTISKIFPNAPRTLLREHYRCHPMIIEFCNQKFYDNQLIILTEPKSERKPLIVYKTVPGNHAKNHVNQRQIDVIKNEIIPQQDLNKSTKSVGIVTPYRNQTEALQRAFAETGIMADTVDKFQGRENDIIVLSTVDNIITEFTDNANRLNVAISRAIEQLIVVVNSDDDMVDKNLGDLMRYIEYNNMEIIHSEIYSVFDYLYAAYQEKLEVYLSKYGKVSEYKSENLMYGLICRVLSNKQFSKFDVKKHVTLKTILRDMERLDAIEKQFIQNSATHVDFLIFDKISKMPQLIIEVDGAAFHAEGTRQAERDKLKNKILKKYKLPYMRFKTKHSGEYERLSAALEEIMNK
jgi:superfamily I DNA and/or RNA helicase/very-short-patch-repair endonuclease